MTIQSVTENLMMVKRWLFALIVGTALMLSLVSLSASETAGPLNVTQASSIANPPGAPAIPTRFKNVASVALPNFTVADATAYAQHQTVFLQASIQGPPQVAAVRFEDISALEQTLHTNTGLNPATLVCFVVFQNSATFSAPSGFPPIVRQHIYEIFDAHTGNLLAVGGSNNL